MGLKNGTSENIGLPELITVLMEFERTNSVDLKLRGELVRTPKGVDLEWTIEAWERETKEQAARLLASVKRRCRESRLLLMEALLLQLLYSVDFELGLLEFQKPSETV